MFCIPKYFKSEFGKMRIAQNQNADSIALKGIK